MTKRLFRNKILTIYKGGVLAFMLNKPVEVGHGDMLRIVIPGLTFYFHIPFTESKIERDIDAPQYGFYYYSEGFGCSDSLWFWWGKKSKVFYMPWTLEWVRTSTKMKDNTWFHETEKNKLDWEDTEKEGSYQWLKNNKWTETHPYIDKYDRTSVNATISVVEREWRRRWMKWTKLFSLTTKVIEVDFDQEVGARKGSWKGGTMGCSYTLLPNEHPLDCLRRMEKERKL